MCWGGPASTLGRDLFGKTRIVPVTKSTVDGSGRDREEKRLFTAQVSLEYSPGTSLPILITTIQYLFKPLSEWILTLVTETNKMGRIACLPKYRR